MINVNLVTDKFVLPNGLLVVLHREPTASSGFVEVRYHVGSKDDPPGRSGFAHVRQELGATYGVSMNANSLRDGGSLAIHAAIDTARTVDALKGLFVELERLRKDPLSDAELSAAKLRTHFDLEHGTAHGLARTLAYAIGKGLPPTYVTTFNGKVDAITAEDVRAAAERRLAKDELRVVLVGDASKILDGVKALGLGDVVVRR